MFFFGTILKFTFLFLSSRVQNSTLLSSKLKKKKKKMLLCIWIYEYFFFFFRRTLSKRCQMTVKTTHPSTECLAASSSIRDSIRISSWRYTESFLLYFFWNEHRKNVTLFHTVMFVYDTVKNVTRSRNIVQYYVTIW